jgi:sortase A
MTDQLDALDLPAKFIETLVSDSPGAEAGAGTPTEQFAIEWDRVMASAQGSASREEEIGRTILVAGRIAREARRSAAPAGNGLGNGNGGGHGLVGRELPEHVTQEVVLAVPYSRIVPEPVPSTGTGLQPVPESLLEPVPSRLTFVANPDLPLALESPPSAEGSGVSKPISVRGQTRHERRRRRLATFFGWVQFVGITLILFVGWQLWGTSIVQHHAQSELRQQFLHHVSEARPGSKTPTLIPADAKVPQPAEGSVVARLQIPAIGVDQYVVEGTAEADLEKGPGHYTGTAVPGQAGNVAIAGHRTTYAAPFYDLNQLASGDLVLLTTDSGELLKYEVKSTPVAVSPSDVSVINNFGDNRLTLTTCNPRFSSTSRLIAVGYLITPTTTASVPASERSGRKGANTADDSGGWHFSSLPIVLLILALLVVLGVATERAKKYLGRHVRWIVIVPLWVAGMYMLFVHLGNLLPAAV